ncbi:MAG: hypothetical protein ACLR9I_03850 [Eisenbergiella sp.]
MARYNVDLQDNEGNAYQIMANPDSVAEFSPAANRENIRSGETHRIIFGKIMKYLSEVGNAAYVGLANNCTTTVEGFALDARQGKELMDRVNELNRDLHALNDSGAIKGLDAREDGVYITYSPTGGADAVTKKLGSPTIKTKAVTGNGSFDAGGKVLFAGIQNAGLHIMTYAQKYGQGSHYSATCSYAGNMITYDQHAYGENTSGTDQYSMTIIYAVE